MWQQRDKLFSRWKERYFILTRDLLQVFRKTTSRMTECGQFIASIKLAQVEEEGGEPSSTVFVCRGGGS